MHRSGVAPLLKADADRRADGARKSRRRLQEIGAQAARVTHELKVPLSLIDGSLQTLEQYTAAARDVIAAGRAIEATSPALELRDDLGLTHLSEHAPALFDICREGTQRLHALIEQIEDYVRGAHPMTAHTLVDVNHLVGQAISLAACGRSAMPVVEATPAAEPWVYGDPLGLSRVFINLIGNAFDAVSDTEDPRVVVSGTGSAADAVVEVRVADNGPGVAPALRARIFEPFFSTKSRRSGLGLGLAIAKEIVEQHGGTLALAPLPDTGATARDRKNGAEFIVRLPVADLAGS